MFTREFRGRLKYKKKKPFVKFILYTPSQSRKTRLQSKSKEIRGITIGISRAQT